MSEALVGHGENAPLAIRINGKDPTFVLGTDRLRARTGVSIGQREQDLLEIAATVFAADGSIRRGGPTRPHMGADWRRNLKFSIPVSDPAHWSRPQIRRAIEDAVAFLTEDDVTFSFTQKPVEPEAEPFLDLDPTGRLFEADRIIMFSGGLDSYAGALETLSQTSEKVVLVTHRSAQKTIPRQVELGNSFDEIFRERYLHLHVVARRCRGGAQDTTQRSRSFLFAALGQAVAKAFSARRLSFFENGVISHNLPLGRQIVGTMATRTTHPLSLRLLNNLCELALEDSVAIDNPYQWLTKTEVVRRIAENGGRDRIMRAVSCTSIRQQDSVRTHCGACSQCLDRRFAIVAAGLEDHEAPEIYETDIFTGAREATMSKTMAVEWTRRMRSYADMTPEDLMAEVGPELSRIIRGHPKLAARDVVRQTLDMHKRQAAIVTSVLEKMFGQQAGALAKGLLPATSLLVLHAGQGGQSAMHKSPEPIRTAFATIDDADRQEDTRPDLAAPLRVAFLREHERDIVAIEGYCRLTGQLARIPVALLPNLLQGRDNDLDTADYPWTRSGQLARDLEQTKASVRQNLARMRNLIAESYEAIHGMAPETPLLVQTRLSHGYRLDPDIDYQGDHRG